MNLKLKLRNNIITRVQQLSAVKLREISDLLNKISGQAKSTEATLKLAGSWKDMDDEIFNDFTTNLHDNRSKDRQIL